MIERGIKQKTIILSVILLVMGLLLTGCGRKNTFDGSRIYKGTEQEKADFILTIPKTGCYHISVTGHRAKGEISFTCIPLKEK